MTKSILPDVETSGADAASVAADRRRLETESRVAEISSLLSALEEAAGAASVTTRPPAMASPAPFASTPIELVPASNPENRLAQVRLGLASALFAALRQRRSELASHSLRVAVGCSTWAMYKRLDDDTRDVVEVAALLHDLGKMGLADAAIAKPLRTPFADVAGGLRLAEASAAILSCCCNAVRILDAVRYAALPFDGSGGPAEMSGDRIPLEARMVAIVDGFDAMTAENGAGAALSREAALERLHAEAGKKFDPILVQQFVEVLQQNQDALTEQVAGRWFSELGQRQTELPWQPTSADLAVDGAGRSSSRSMFEHHLLEAMHDGVVFVDAQARISMWSKGAERLTGVSASAAAGRKFSPALLDMCNTAGRRVREEMCPVKRTLEGRMQLRQRLEILGRSGRHVAIDLHAVPVVTGGGDLVGATVMLHDAQPEASLEEKCEALHAEVTKDPMTKVANRAEFDRMQALYIETHQHAGMPCSLIMIDIDHFKHINDNYGHQAGDEAIITVATLLKQMCRSGDLVARYGGEEFAVLCADCSGEDAVQRAEQIRRTLSETPHSYLGNKRLTASFGVAELQSGDTPETMLSRADRGLLLAKERGRNQVVQLGSRMSQQTERKSRWWSFGAWKTQPIGEVKLSTEVPANIAIEKLRGFVTDYNARVVSTRENRVEIELSSEHLGQNRRGVDRPLLFRVEIELSERREERRNTAGLAAGTYVLTDAHVIVRPRKARNRRQGDQLDRSRLILQSLKAYLMAKEIEGT